MNSRRPLQELQIAVAMVAHPPRAIKPGRASALSASRRRVPEIERRLHWALRRRKAQRHRDRGDSDAEGTDIEPAIALEGIEYPSAGQRSQRHAEAGERGHGAEY